MVCDQFSLQSILLSRAINCSFDSLLAPTVVINLGASDGSIPVLSPLVLLRKIILI